MKYRVIVNGVSFYTTGAAIRRGVGDFVGVNTAVRMVYKKMQNAIEIGCTGLATSITVYDDRMQSTRYDVQISKV